MVLCHINYIEKNRKNITMVEQTMTTHVLRLGGKHYQVKTDSDKECCDVKCINYAWTCSCPDYQSKKKRCNHIDMVEISTGMRDLSYPRTEIEEILEIQVATSLDGCVYCHSKNVREHSIRHNKSGDVQRYVCRDCKRKFSLTKTVNNYDIVVEVMDLHLAGKKNTEIAEMLAVKHEDEKITEILIGEWIANYKNIIQNYYIALTRTRIPHWDYSIQGFEPDEIYKRAKRDIRFLYAILDYDTKVWLAKEVQTNHTEYIKNLSPYKAKQIKAFYNNQCTILHV
jgi:putative transposase